MAATAFLETANDAADEGIEVSVVMPCLNEADTLTVCVEKCHTAMRAAGSTAR